MKTPREMLLGRHKHAEPRLNCIGEEILRNRFGTAEEYPRISTGLRRWFWPSAAAWGAVAAVWTIIAFLNFDSAATPHAKPAAVFAQSKATLDALREQRRLFVELVTMPDADVELRRAPRPQSRRPDLWVVV